MVSTGRTGRRAPHAHIGRGPRHVGRLRGDAPAARLCPHSRTSPRGHSADCPSCPHDCTECIRTRTVASSPDARQLDDAPTGRSRQPRTASGLAPPSIAQCAASRKPAPRIPCFTASICSATFAFDIRAERRIDATSSATANALPCATCGAPYLCYRSREPVGTFLKWRHGARTDPPTGM
ncbi:hypothetical protein BSIN_1730 [Burkholderia singularis]|uniref:Uncharacterized protein n=1 Tax=Burkholderia singularis TaxID=1503053 RepID=A0A238GZQ0_9BURK|nr:hypothetical protein BSIN_1730 [Burkholderia singularis]